jgi:hypothetical protein
MKKFEVGLEDFQIIYTSLIAFECDLRERHSLISDAVGETHEAAKKLKNNISDVVRLRVKMIERNKDERKD